MRLIFLLFVLAACELTPNFVDTKDIDEAVARKAWKTVCKGLEMKEDKVRRYATEKLHSRKAPNANECICGHIETKAGGLDAAVAAGLVGVKDDNLVGCFANVVKRSDLPKRMEAVVALALTAAPLTRQTLAEIAVGTGDVETRARAAAEIGGDPRFAKDLLSLMQNAPDPILRAAAATGLAGSKDRSIVDALVDVATQDEDGTVRGAALIAAKQSGVSKADEMVCTAMMDDPSPEVRKAAVGAFKGTRRDSAVKCLRKRALTFEEDAGVRDKLLAVLKSSPNDNAALVLCDAIPFWMRSYVIEDIPGKVPGAKIVKTQNDRDWERSYECFERAYRNSSGYSCFARMHVAAWFREVGGKPFVPECPGYKRTE